MNEIGARSVEHEYTLNWSPILRHLEADKVSGSG